jgi:signal transduction histidine kinase
MDEELITTDAPTLDENAGLETVLFAWHAATIRLEQTHEALRAEVRRLTDELEVKNRELARKNRLADLGQMAAHIAHEVRNNLVPVTLYLSLLRRRIAGDAGSLEVLEKIEQGFAALDVTVNDLLNFTSDRDPVMEPFALGKLVEELAGSLRPQLEAQAIDMVIEVPENQTITADRDMLRRAVLNLILNAVDAMPKGGTLTVRSARGPEGIEISVADTGPGMSKETQAKAFEPFYTTKQGGTGLGLAIVYRIAEVHGGSVTAANGPESGALVTLSLPQAALEAAA